LKFIAETARSAEVELENVPSVSEGKLTIYIYMIIMPLCHMIFMHFVKPK
jgi:hypothetical protein